MCLILFGPTSISPPSTFMPSCSPTEKTSVANTQYIPPASPQLVFPPHESPLESFAPRKKLAGYCPLYWLWWFIVIPCSISSPTQQTTVWALFFQDAHENVSPPFPKLGAAHFSKSFSGMLSQISSTECCWITSAVKSTAVFTLQKGFNSWGWLTGESMNHILWKK